MKINQKTLALLLAAVFSAQVHAAETGDTLVINRPDKVRIETSDTVQRIVIDGMRLNSDFRYTQTVEIPNASAVKTKLKHAHDYKSISIKKKGKDTKFTSSGYANLGLNTMLSAPSECSFKLLPSIDFGLGLTFNYHPFGKLNVWGLGFGVDWKYYRMSKSSYWAKDAQGMMYMEDAPLTVSDKRTSMEVVSLQVPVFYRHYFGNTEGWAITLGGIVNFNTSAHTTQKFTQGDYETEIELNAIGQRPVTIDVMGAVTIPGFATVYCKYCPMKFFKDDRGPKMNQLSFGFMW